MTQPLKITVEWPDGSHVTVKPGEMPPEAPAIPDAGPLRIGMSYKSEEADDVLAPYDVAPAFRRLFVPPGKGMPNLQGADMKSTPARTVPWWSHKDQPDPSKIPGIWSALARRYPGRKIPWTFQHEANDLPYAEHRKGWETLSALRAVHPDGEQIELWTVLTAYYARYKSDGEWRKWVMPDLVQGVAFDCYTPLDRPTYEDAASLLGIVDQAQHEHPHLLVGCAEWGSALLPPDKGVKRALWVEDCVDHALSRGYSVLGFWNSWETRGGKKIDYRAHDEPTITALRGAMKA